MTDDYFAGLFDGEGCVCLRSTAARGRVNYTSLTVSVQMRERAPLDALCERFGGRVGTYNKHGAMYHWYMSGTKSEPALRVFADRCIIKQDEALLGLELIPLLRENRVRGKRAKGIAVHTAENYAARVDIHRRFRDLREERKKRYANK